MRSFIDRVVANCEDKKWSDIRAMQLVTNMRLNKMEKQKEIDFQRLDWIKAKKERHRIITINYERQELNGNVKREKSGKCWLLVWDSKWQKYVTTN